MVLALDNWILPHCSFGRDVVSRVLIFFSRLAAFAYRHTLKRLLLFASYQIGGLLLVGSHTRQKINQIYNQLSPRRVLWFCKVFDRAPIWSDFVWLSEFNGKTLSVPVMRGMLRSWCNARHWKWFAATSKGTDLFYRFIVENMAPSVMFDVGANDGLHAYKFALHGFRCICFEPQQACVEYIHRVCELNRFDHVKVEPCVLSDKEGQVEFFTSESTWYSSVDRHHTEHHEAVTKHKTKAMTLDQYCREQDVFPAVVKIDVEGHELNVLRGGESVIARCRPHLVMEIWPGSENKKDIWFLLKQYGYMFIGDDGVVLGSLEQFMASSNLDYILISDPGLSGRFLKYSSRAEMSL